MNLESCFKGFEKTFENLDVVFEMYSPILKRWIRLVLLNWAICRKNLIIAWKNLIIMGKMDMEERYCIFQ